MIQLIKYLQKHGVDGVKGMKAKKRVTEILDIASGDEKVSSLVQEVLDKAVGYVSAVFKMETTLVTQRYRLEGEELRELTERMDRLRRIAHNALIDSIRICNRYLFKTYGNDIPAGGVYSKDPMHLSGETNRIAIGDWAGEVVLSFFSDRAR